MALVSRWRLKALSRRHLNPPSMRFGLTLLPFADPCLAASGHTARATPERLASFAEISGFLLFPVDPYR